jgi:hypothetical protein
MLSNAVGGSSRLAHGLTYTERYTVRMKVAKVAASASIPHPEVLVITLSVDFCREASDLETAIRTAVADVSSAGGVVDRVEIDADAPILKD